MYRTPPRRLLSPLLLRAPRRLRVAVGKGRGASASTTASMTLGFVGLGQMGARMAANLLEKVRPHPYVMSKSRLRFSLCACID